MDLMSIRRGLMMGMVSGLPRYLKQYSIIPSEDTRTLTIPVGDEFSCALIASTCPQSGLNNDTVKNGTVNYFNDSLYAYTSRLTVQKTNGSLTYYASSSANQSWSYADGILTISCTSGWYFGANIRYDIFYW